MLEEKIAVVVTEGGHLVGILPETDVLRLFVNGTATMARCPGQGLYNGGQ